MYRDFFISLQLQNGGSFVVFFRSLRASSEIYFSQHYYHSVISFKTVSETINSRLSRTCRRYRDSLPTDYYDKTRTLSGETLITTVNDLFLAWKACFISEDAIFTAIHLLHSVIESARTYD